MHRMCLACIINKLKTNLSLSLSGFVALLHTGLMQNLLLFVHLPFTLTHLPTVSKQHINVDRALPLPVLKNVTPAAIIWAAVTGLIQGFKVTNGNRSVISPRDA